MDFQKNDYVRVASYEGQPGKVKKVVLLYSGGLDTSISLKWIQDTYKAEVVTLTVDLGQPTEDISLIKKKALKLGAKAAYVLDLKREFANGYISKAIKANGLYEGKYPLSSAISRYVTVKAGVDIARKIKADAIAHGCTGKGNSQVRFDLAITTLDPKLKVIAPIREWGISRDAGYKYAKENNIPVVINKKSLYSVDENLWGRGIASGILEDPSKEPPQDTLGWVTRPEDAPNKPEYVTLTFKNGVPTELNGKKMELYKLIMKLNSVAGKHGVGLIDHVEDRIVGLKSRDYYECPGAVTILEAHKDLEKYVCTIHENLFKEIIDSKWAQMAYFGLWFDPLMDALNAFVDVVNEKVTGIVRLKLYKGVVIVVGRESKYALYDMKLNTYFTGQTFNRQASTGFIELFGLESKMANLLRKSNR